MGRARALITGGAGFIGSHLAERLLADGEEVTIIDDLSTGSFENIAHLEQHPNFRYIIDTILNEQVMGDLIDESDTVYHLAAAVGVAYVIENILKSIQINIRGTEIVFEQANRGKKKVILFSTSEIYGKSNSLPFREDQDRLMGSPTVNRWSYAATKVVDEILALAYHREKKVPVVVVRCFNTCGPRQTGQYGMVLPRFVKQALLGVPITVYGDGKQSRCFSSVQDVVEGVVRLARSEKAVGRIFNIGSDHEITIEDLAARVRELAGSSSPIEYVPYERAYEQGFEDMQRRVPDLTRIHEAVGFEPKVALDELIQSVISHFKR
ncbi:MAG: GDP-mannose 4,6-dehydratase [Candidatus Eisenbacteria bacterium]|nr:GDP-mannose 4,6-dehydratase [Candidatus Eisenbacteria bacterium]